MAKGSCAENPPLVVLLGSAGQSAKKPCFLVVWEFLDDCRAKNGPIETFGTDIA